MSDSNQKVGFVSLGCPKALVDSERILTQLKLDGYEISPDYDDADVVVVNTCGFIDSAKQESMDAISEAMKENGKVIVTGCMGKGVDAEAIIERSKHFLKFHRSIVGLVAVLVGGADDLTVVHAAAGHEDGAACVTHDPGGAISAPRVAPHC